MSDTTHKAERLASAIYLLTSFFDDNEPLKWRLRDLSSDLVAASLEFKDSRVFEGLGESKIRTNSIAGEISSHLRVCKNAGLISDTNHSLIQEEFSKYVGNTGVSEAISEMFKEVPKIETPAQQTIEQRQVIKDKSDVRESKPAQSVPQSPAPQSEYKDEYLPPVKPEDEKKPELKEFGAVSLKKNARQSAIIGLLKRKKEIMIKDVSSIISDCSEKTIQRELLSMVDAGILKKTGEKRWSRYSLA